MAADPKTKTAAKPRTSRAKKAPVETPAPSNLPATIPAEELSPDERQAQAEAAFVINERIKEGIRAGQQALWIVASGLYEFEETAGWLALGFESKSHWLADPDISMSRRTYNRLVHAWRVLVVQRQLDPGELAGLDVSKVDMVLPRVEKGEVKLETALEDVKALGAKDLREAYFKPKLGRPKVVDADSATITDTPTDAPSEPGDEPQDVADALGHTHPVEREEAVERAEAEAAAEADGEIDEFRAMKLYDARSAAEKAMTAWTVDRTIKVGNDLYVALQALLELTA